MLNKIQSMNFLMVNINNINVKFEPNNMCICDKNANTWNGTGYFDFIWLDFDSGIKNYPTIMRIPDNAFSEDNYVLTERNFDQIAPNVTAQDIIKIFKDNEKFFLDCFSKIINSVEC